MSDNSILICGEIAEGVLDPKTFELLGIGRKLANDLNTKLSIALIGEKLTQIAEEVASFGADKVYAVENPLLGSFKADLWIKALEELCNKINPGVIIMLHSFLGMEVAPRLSFRLNSVLTTDCIDLKIDSQDGLLLRTKPVYGGNAIAVYKYQGDPQFVTVRGKVMSPAERTATRGEIVDFTPDLDESMVKIDSIETVKEEAVSLDKAEVIISGGRGMGGEEGFKSLEDLVDLFKGSFENVELGGSRPAVDSGWISSGRQIGLTGEKVSPVLYMAVGISGAMQHLVGMMRSKKIVAINNDPKSSIFNVADYGIVEDYREVLPAFVKKWKELS